MRYVKYLILMTADENEICYDLNEIVKISNDYANNILKESEFEKYGFKPLEMITVITLKSGDTAVFSTAKLELSFD